MTALLKALGGFLAPILKAVLALLLQEGKKPREVKPAGYDEDLQNDINSSIEDSINERE